MVAAAGRYAKGLRVQEAPGARTAKYEKLLDTIEYLKTQQNGLMTTVERANRLLKGCSEQMQNGPGRGGETHRRGRGVGA